MKLLVVCDESSKIIGHRYLNSQISFYIGIIQFGVCIWATAQHVFSIVRFKKVLHCDFVNGTKPVLLVGVDIIIFDIGLFHSLWNIESCVAQHLDGGYGRFTWCICHILALLISLPFAFVSRPPPCALWPLLIQQSAYGIGLLILSLSALPRILPIFTGYPNGASLFALAVYIFGTAMNSFLLYVYWHWYWHVESMWNSARKLRPNHIIINPNMRSKRTLMKPPPEMFNTNLTQTTSKTTTTATTVAPNAVSSLQTKNSANKISPLICSTDSNSVAEANIENDGGGNNDDDDDTVGSTIRHIPNYCGNSNVRNNYVVVNDDQTEDIENDNDDYGDEDSDENNDDSVSNRSSGKSYDGGTDDIDVANDSSVGYRKTIAKNFPIINDNNDPTNSAYENRKNSGPLDPLNKQHCQHYHLKSVQHNDEYHRQQQHRRHCQNIVDNDRCDDVDDAVPLTYSDYTPTTTTTIAQYKICSNYYEETSPVRHVCRPRYNGNTAKKYRKIRQLPVITADSLLTTIQPNDYRNKYLEQNRRHHQRSYVENSGNIPTKQSTKRLLPLMPNRTTDSSLIP